MNPAKNTLTSSGRQFLLNGQPFQIISGTIHYFRVVPEYWEDRLAKLAACGFNCVETYTCWNLHERTEGMFDFTGRLDIAEFLETAKRLGLYVILRPGPYICAEWEFGGFPAWILKDKAMRLRCLDSAYMEKIRNYLHALFAQVRPYLGSNGGPIIAVQIENEYGSYGDDKAYLNAVKEIYEAENIKEFLFTSDGPTRYMLSGGTLPGVFSGVNFGDSPKESFAIKDDFRPGEPAMCCEFWDGWFDHWTENHGGLAAERAAKDFEEIIKSGASVNVYMFHGGTNFGFMNGANFDQVYQPDVTSYDYDAPLTENGDRTEKYERMRRIIADTLGQNRDLKVQDCPRTAFGAVTLTNAVRLFDCLDPSNTVHSSSTHTMEELGGDYGFVLYRTELCGPFEELELCVDGLHDRAIFYLDGNFLGIKDRMKRRDDSIKIRLESGERAELQILVENMGRINYGPKMRDEKGILSCVRLGRRIHFGWDMTVIDQDFPAKLTITSPCPLTAPVMGDELQDGSLPGYGPVVFSGHFTVDEPADTFVRPTGFEKGAVYINGFCLGRYWNSAGPQKTLYLPAPLLRRGDNEIRILELERADHPEILLEDTPDLG